MFRFAHPDYLYLLSILPLLVVLYIFFVTIRNRNIKKFGNLQTMQILMPTISRIREHIRFVIYMVAIGFMILALARPQMGAKLRTVQVKGYEVVIALDISNSMLAEDISPNRLERAKKAIEQMIRQFGNDRVGLVVFAGQAHIQLPMTADYEAAESFLSSISTDLISAQGTSIAQAMSVAGNMFTPDLKENKFLIIISDGEDHEQGAVTVATQLLQQGIHTYTIGIGTPKGVLIPIYGKNGQKDYMKDGNGDNVQTRLNEEVLQEIAGAGEGAYIQASNSNIGLGTVIEDMNKAKKEEMEARVFDEYNEQYQWFFGYSIVFVNDKFLDTGEKK